MTCCGGYSWSRLSRPKQQVRPSTTASGGALSLAPPGVMASLRVGRRGCRRSRPDSSWRMVRYWSQPGGREWARGVAGCSLDQGAIRWVRLVGCEVSVLIPPAVCSCVLSCVECAVEENCTGSCPDWPSRGNLVPRNVCPLRGREIPVAILEVFVGGIAVGRASVWKMCAVSRVLEGVHLDGGVSLPAVSLSQTPPCRPAPHAESDGGDAGRIVRRGPPAARGAGISRRLDGS